MMTDPLIDAYEDCLKALETGAALDEVLARYPALQAELRPLLTLAMTIRAMGETASAPRPVGMADRAQWLARAAQPPRPAARGLRARPVWRTALAVLTLVLIVGTYGVVAASAQSVPGDALYGVKRSVESVQLWFVSDPQEKMELEAEFEERRIEEVHALTQQKRTAPIEFSGRIESLADDIWLVSGVRVVITPSTQVNGAPFVGASVSVHGVSQADGMVLAEEIEIKDEDEEVEEEEEETENTPSTRPAPTLTVTAPAATRTHPAPTNTPTQAPVSAPTHTPVPPPATLVPAPTHTPVPAPATPTSAPTETQGEEIEFSGLLEAMTGNVWRIGGLDVQITAETEIDDRVAIGKWVDVEAWRMPDGGIVAREIDVEDESDKSPTPEQPGTPQPSATKKTETPEPTATRWPTRTRTPTRTATP